MMTPRQIPTYLSIQLGNSLLRQLRAGTVSPVKLETLRTSIKAGDCPFCSCTGFAVVAQHIQRVHHLSSRELRDLVGFDFSESICSAEHHKLRSELTQENNPRKYKAPDYASRTYSKKGKEQLRKAGHLTGATTAATLTRNTAGQWQPQRGHEDE